MDYINDERRHEQQTHALIYGQSGETSCQAVHTGQSPDASQNASATARWLPCHLYT